MSYPWEGEKRLARAKRIFVIGIITWTIFIGISLSWNVYIQDRQTYELARNTAKIHFQKDLSFRLWATKHGGVYVPIDERTPPNPYLDHIPDRDVVTLDGKELTLMNPAYMLRQLMSEHSDIYGATGHITSLNPLNPVNAPDNWEKKALHLFEQGETEISEIVTIDGNENLKYMEPLIVKQGCLKCHEQQGYELGDVRGGVSINVPIASFVASAKNVIIGLYETYSLIWLIGIFAIGFLGWRNNKYIREASQKEQELFESVKKYQGLFDDALDMIHIVDTEGYIVDANNAELQLMGYEKEDYIRKPFIELIDPDYKEITKEKLNKVLQGDSIHNFETVMQTQTGMKLNVLVNAVPEIEDGKVVAVRSIIHDITKIKLYQQEREKALSEAQRANKVKTEFLANMSHEIRTPLNAISGFTDIVEELTKDKINKEDHSYFDIIRHSSQRLINTVHGILDLSQIEAGAFHYNPQYIDLYSIVKNTVIEFSILIDNSDIDLTFNSQVKQAPIKADESTLTRAISNLIDNAIKYTNEGQVDVNLSKNGSNYILSIKDTGIGISKDYMKIMYEAFTQESSGYTKKYQGLGLGLAVTKRCLDLDNIPLDVKSVRGEGTTFTLTLKTEENPRIIEEPEPLAMSQTKIKSSRKPLVMVVEDDLDTQRLVEITLRDSFETCFAISVVEAKEHLETKPIAALVLDLSLQGNEDGLDLVHFMRNLEKWKNTPVIAVTAHAFVTDRENVLVAGCNDYMSKPINRHKLAQMISKYLEV